MVQRPHIHAGGFGVEFRCPPGEPTADEAYNRPFASIRPRRLDGDTWVYPAVLARPEVTRYGDDLDLVTREVLQDAAFIQELPGVAVIAEPGQPHRDIVDMRDQQSRGRMVGKILFAWYDDDEDALVGLVAVDVPEVNEAIQARPEDGYEPLRGVSLAYQIQRRPATQDERTAHGVTRVQVRRFAPRNLAILYNVRATAAIVADGGDAKIGVRMKPTQAAALVEFGLDRLEQRESLLPIVDEVLTLRKQNTQLAADAADAPAPDVVTGGDWIALAKLRERLGMSNDELGDYAEALTETLAKAGVQVPEGADPAMLKLLLSTYMAAVGEAAPAEDPAAEEAAPEEDEAAPGEDGMGNQPEPDVAADGRGSRVRDGVGRRNRQTNNNTPKTSGLAGVVIGG